MPKPRQTYETQISQRDGVWGCVLTITTASKVWTSTWGAFPQAQNEEQAQAAANLIVKRMKEKTSRGR